jgi:ABC-type dipeptide/oligopeptide/nickel transport system permease component
MGPIFAILVTGTFVTETVFGIPGMGKYFVTSITNRDYTVIMGTILLFAIIIVIANLVVDLVYAWLDPRIRYT